MVYCSHSFFEYHIAADSSRRMLRSEHMSDRMTELDLVVGSMFTTGPDEDRDLFEDEREWLSDIQDLLREEGVEVDLLSRPGVEIWEGGIDRFMDLYQLRQIAAYLEQDRDIAPLLE